MAHLGRVSRKDDLFFARVDTQESGVRYKMEGPPRSDRAGSSSETSTTSALRQKEDATRAEGLQSMKLAQQKASCAR